MSQRSLFDDTRRQAAAAIEPLAPTMQARVLAFIRDRGQRGATDQEIAAGLDMLPDTARARRVELVKAGQVRPSGVTRPSQHGGPRPRPCDVWITMDVIGTTPPATRPEQDPPTSPAECKCGSTRFNDVRLDHPPHNGQSVRRDCARCKRTWGFPLWYGQAVGVQPS